MLYVNMKRFSLIFIACIVMETIKCQEQAPAAQVFNLPSGHENILNGPVREGFSCEGKSYGYYADVNNDCQIFHICYPVFLENGPPQMFMYSFFCPNQTAFDQERLTCIFRSPSFDCAASVTFADAINAEFGKIVPQSDGNSEVEISEESIVQEQYIDTPISQQSSRSKYRDDQNIYLDQYAY